MSLFMRALQYESSKVITSRAWWIMTSIVVLFQGLISFVDGIGYAQIGIDATPETEPALLAPLPPIQYFGFDTLPFGEAVIVVTTAILASDEYRNREHRTTALAVNRRMFLLVSKLVSFTGLLLALSLVSIFGTIATVHLGIGSEGLDPINLPSETWKYIALSAAYWALIALLSYLMAFASRSWIPPMVLLLPQVTGLGDWLGSKWSVGAYLPVRAGHCWAATPEMACTPSSVPHLLPLLAWVVAVAGLAGVLYQKRDMSSS